MYVYIYICNIVGEINTDLQPILFGLHQGTKILSHSLT